MAKTDMHSLLTERYPPHPGGETDSEKGIGGVGGGGGWRQMETMTERGVGWGGDRDREGGSGGSVRQSCGGECSGCVVVVVVVVQDGDEDSVQGDHTHRLQAATRLLPRLRGSRRHHVRA